MTTGRLLIGLTLLGLTLPLAARAEDQPIEVQVVDAMNKVFGQHPGFRANHAKGIVAEGSFKASPEAAELSRAVLFDGSTIPVTVRFSDSTGIPNLPDGCRPRQSPWHGDQVPSAGRQRDRHGRPTPSSSSRSPPARNSAICSWPWPPARRMPPSPTKLEQFIATHPRIPAALATVATPDSFADEQYYGLDAFIFVNKAGQRQAVRYMIVPEHLVHLAAGRCGQAGAEFPDGRAARSA